MAEGYLSAVSGEEVPRHADDGPHDDEDQDMHQVAAQSQERQEGEKAEDYVGNVFFHDKVNENRRNPITTESGRTRRNANQDIVVVIFSVTLCLRGFSKFYNT